MAKNLVAAHYSYFTWDCNNKAAAHGVAEMSDLKNVLHDRWQHLGHNKEGIMVQGRTCVIPFVIVTVNYNDDRDITHWDLMSDHERFKDCTLTIFND